MSLPVITKNRDFIAKLCTCWIPIKIYRKKLRAIIQMGVHNYLQVIRNEKNATFKHELSIVAIMKNEGPYLKEWIDFHLLVGVEKFYLYDNESTDDTVQILKPYIERGIVDYTFYPGKMAQNPAYIDAINKHAYDSRWLAFIDLDEFIVPIKYDTIPELLRTLPRNFGALVLTWIMYGSSGHKEKPNGLVIENFKYYGDKTRNSGCKSIMNPRLCVRQRNPHINDFAGFLIDENGKKLGTINQSHNPTSHNKIRCNHYVTKSLSEYCARHKLHCSGGCTTNANYRGMDKFARYDTNDITDDVMDKWIAKLKAQSEIK